MGSRRKRVASAPNRLSEFVLRTAPHNALSPRRPAATELISFSLTPHGGGGDDAQTTTQRFLSVLSMVCQNLAASIVYLHGKNKVVCRNDDEEEDEEDGVLATAAGVTANESFRTFASSEMWKRDNRYTIKR